MATAIQSEYTQIYLSVNSCAAELFVSIFHSYEAGIANAIFSFK